MKYRLLLVVGFLGSYLTCFGQTTGLADEYYRNGEFDKAATEYSKQIRQGGSGVAVWPNVYKYVNSLKKVNKSDEALKFLKKQARSDEPNRSYYDLLTGFVYRDQNDTTKTRQAYEAALADSKNSADQLGRVGAAFAEIGETSWAITALLNARAVDKDETLYSEDLANLYRATGATEKWIDELLTLSQVSEKKETVLNNLQTLINTKEEAVLEKVLYSKIQKYPNVLQYNETLSWFYIQKQKFGRALIQEKAVDKRMRLNGSRIYDLGVMAMNNKEYKAASDAFDYIITNYPQSPLYPFSRRMVINAREEQVKNTYPVDKADIRRLIGDYRKMLGELGSNAKTWEALRSTANLYAYYLDEKDSALVALDQAIGLSRSDGNFTDKCKLDKGDIYLLKEEPWESTLLYSQVEKSQKEELLGYEAKLRNAKLHYYKGEFELAKDLLDILKRATSREIANDAEQLSLLILDNTGLDTSEAAMREYAAIDLLLFQNKTDEAITDLNKMFVKFKGHALADEILWLRAKTYEKQGKFDEAIEDLKTIVQTYPLDILGDDALFMQGRLLEERKKDTKASMDIYQKFLTTYPGSIHAAEARKRFRALRGDVLN